MILCVVIYLCGLCAREGGRFAALAGVLCGTKDIARLKHTTTKRPGKRLGRLAHLHGRALPKALCVQRMPEGCFRTFATPTEVGRGMERAVGLGGGGGNHSFAVRVGPASDPRFGPAGSARALQGLVPRPSTTIEEDESTKAIVEAARAARRSVKAGGKARRTLFVDVADGWVEQSRLLHREGFVGALEKAVSLEAVRDTMAALSKWPSSRGEWKTCASNTLVLNKCMAVC